MASPLAASSAEVAAGSASSSGAVPMAAGTGNSIPINVAAIVLLSAAVLVAFDMLNFKFVVGANVG